MPRRRRYRNNNPNPALVKPNKPQSNSRGGAPRQGVGLTIKRLLTAIIIIGILSVLGALLVFAYFAKDLPNPDEVLNQEFAETTKILARDGATLLYEIHGKEKRTIVSFEKIPKPLKQATLAAEDDEFYSHSGVDLRSILRAIITDIRTRSVSQGGSTITQQFIKNTLLSPEKRFSRKIREIILAFELERRYSKDEIFWLYLNTIPYGSNAYGVQAAAQTYFGKNVSELSLAEMALIAALPKAPTYLSPYGSHVDELVARQRYILERMQELGYISPEEVAEAKAEKLAFSPQRTSIFAPHFVMYVRELLEAEFGKELVERGGLEVVTTLDPKLQNLAEEVLTKQAEINEERYNGKNAALVTINPATGEVLAMVGSRDYFDLENDGNVNVALRPRQPGSALKPFIYAAAFLKGYTPNTILYDVVTEFGAKGARSYQPKDYDGKERGPVTMRSALAQSLNIPAVKTLYLAGLQDTLAILQAAGITTFTDPERFGLSLVLGGAEVKLLELTSAYGIFANHGKWVPHQVIKSIKDRKGQVIFEAQSTEVETLPAEIAYLVTDILADNEARAPMFGQYNNLTLPGRPAAAKTGTTQDFRDGWIFGYTPSLVTGVWTGNNDNSSMRPGAAGAGTAGPIWNKFMREALADKPPQPFPEAPERRTGKPILDGEATKVTLVAIDRVSGKRATDFTPPQLIEEVPYHEAHTILYYVDRNDPLGPPPANPEVDPQFNNWETAVLAWAAQPEREGKYNLEPPQETDDVHLPEYKPRLSILSPKPQAKLTSNLITVSIEASAPMGIGSILVFFDNLYLGSWDNTSQLSFQVPWEKYNKGNHTITIAARDIFENETKTSIPITLEVQKNTSPVATLTHEGGDFPITLVVNISSQYKGAFTKVNFYAEDTARPWKRVLIASTQQKSGPYQYRAAWTAENTAPGHYQIYAILRDQQGYFLRSTPVEIAIAPPVEALPNEDVSTTSVSTTSPEEVPE